MTPEQRQAYEWAKNQNYTSVAARYAKVLTDLVDAAEVAQKPLRIEITTDDFTNKDLAKEKGYYRKHYFCPVCDIEIGHKTFDKTSQFGQGTVLHSNEFPNHCPNCGAKLILPEREN